MKLLIRLISVFLVIVFACYSSGTALALEYDNYKTFDVPEEEIADFLQERNFRSVNKELIGRTFSGYAVSEQGQIALYFSGENASINVYDLAGSFQYCLQFQNGGSSTIVFFEDEVLSVLWGKSDYIGSFDADGNCLQFQKFLNIKSNADAYHNDRYHPNSGRIGNKQYFAERAGLSIQYNRFSIEDETGNRIVIYDATKEATVQSIVTCALAAMGVLFAYVIRKYNQKESQVQSDD